MKQPPNDERLRWEQLYKDQEVETMPWYYPEIEPEVKKALKEMNITSGHILDLGTGPGTQAMALAKMGFGVTAVDISAAAIEKAKIKSKQERLDIDFFQDDIVNTKINDKFDFIFDRGCFHTLSPEKRDIYVKNVRDLLKPEGILFLKCFSYKEKSEGGPYRFTPEQIENYFHHYFKIISITDSIFQGTRKPLPKALFSILKSKSEKQKSKLDHMEVVKVFSIGDPFTIATAKSLLESAKIQYFVKNEILGHIWLGISNIIAPTEIWVKKEDEENARKLLEELE